MSALSTIDRQRKLMAALVHAAAQPPAVALVEVIETHISWVLLIGEYAYKFKKALNLGFLDYTTLEQRHHFCLEELRLNRRTAPTLYLQVVAITGTSDHPVIGGAGEAIEWAVKMQRFEQSQLASQLVQQDQLTFAHIDRLAHGVADFHWRIARAEPLSHFGSVESVCQPIEENFRQIHSLGDAADSLRSLQQLRDWYNSAIPKYKPLLERRKQEGYIRECHGDLHLGNIVIIGDEPTPFDGIEFNDNLRYVDVISEIAFLLMDLDHRQCSDLGWRFLDGYLQESGDFAGLGLLRFYQVYRAMVRAKVAAIRASQEGIDDTEHQSQLAEVESYLQQALNYTHSPSPQLLLTHGFSGSGKSSVAQRLLEQWGAVRIRSDVERKRLFGLGAAARSDSKVAEGIYTADASAQTYTRLAQLSALLLDAGFNVIVDATFLRRADREPLIRLAQSCHVPWHLLDVTASVSTLRERIVTRDSGHRDASEADRAVLDHQLSHHDPLTVDEQAHCINVNTDGEWTIEPIIRALI
ncbi:MAG TPA: AAA family ATPase [Gammaproteobacteria bacterium]